MADILRLTSMQQTFSVGVSQSMVPSAHIVVFAVLDNGEIISDALNFHVQGTRKDKVCL